MLNQNAKKNQVNQEKPLKRFGQNFLIDKTIISRIVEQLKIKPTDTIIEIGPGHGELTEKILENKPKRIIAIEKDRRLAQKLVSSLAVSNKNIKVIEGDTLKVIPELFTNELKSYRAIKLVGNIPYYITGHLLRILGELENKPEIIVLTIQKEVAERIVAKPPKMNLLSASVQFWGTPEIIQIIDKEKFNPVPKVDSAIIRIVPVKSQVLRVKGQGFYSLIKILFKQPRKTILNNLKEFTINNRKIPTEEIQKILKKCNIDPKLRPQNLSIEEIKLIAKQLS